METPFEVELKPNSPASNRRLQFQNLAGGGGRQEAATRFLRGCHKKVALR